MHATRISTVFGLLASLSLLTNTATPSETPIDKTIQLGPKGEIPVANVSDSEVKSYAASFGISYENARFLTFEGGRELVQFNTEYNDDERFGAWALFTLRSLLSNCAPRPLRLTLPLI